MFKKNLKAIIAVLLICVMACSLVACTTRLNGTYTSSNGLIKQSFTFKDDDVVVISAFGINAEGTYKIEDNTITITYKLLNLSYDLEKSFEKDGDKIIIDGTEFVKEK